MIRRPAIFRALFSCTGLAVGGLLSFAFLSYWFLLPDSRLLHKLTLEDRTELRLIQQGSAMFYDVGLYVKPPAAPWEWFFVDKDELSWRWRGKLVWDIQRQTVDVYRGDKRLAEYSPSRGIITVYRMSQPVRAPSRIQGEPPF